MKAAPASGKWYRLMAVMLSRHPVVKGLGTVTFIAVFFAAYFYLLKYPATPPVTMPFTWVAATSFGASFSVGFPLISTLGSLP